MGLIAALLLIGGAFNLIAAVMGLRRQGELQSTMGRQLSSMLGKRGTIAFWLVLGLGLSAAGVALLLRSGA